MASVGEARYVGNIHHNFPRGGGGLCNYYVRIIPSDVECNHLIIKHYSYVTICFILV